jgi:MoaA/NifB/PqqE/SkfB family radical SAM enzyme|tara:strand:- start:7712 stop:8977 length:1266 start_codon:yes stop_codon:yes gene_type:complete
MKKEELLESKSFCIMPWVHLATDPNGENRICCLANKNIKINKKKTNLGYDKIADIFNSDYIKEVRKEMLNGNKIKECTACWDAEEAGGLTQRQVFTKQWLDDMPELVNTINNDGNVEYDPMYYDFRFGNLCNLKCRSCGSLNSSQLYKENKQLIKLHDIDFWGNAPELELINDWYKTETFKNNVYTNIDGVRKIYFTGGEPTLVDENYQLMRRMIELDVAKNVSLTFNTNMTNLKDEFYDLIQQFKHVEIAISIEGYGKIQEYLRFPSKWSQIEKNVRRMANMPKNIWMFAVPVVQSVNLEYIIDFFKFIQSINEEMGYYRIALLPIVLDNPAKLSMDILPLEYKQQCFDKLNSYVQTQEWLLNDPHFTGRFNNIKNVCNRDGHNTNLLTEFKKFSIILDKHRKQNLQDVNPKLWEILQNV